MMTRWLSPEVRQRFARDRSAMFGLAIVVSLLLFATLGPILIPADPNLSDFSLPRSAVGGPPSASWAHPLGADGLHRDLLARLAHGARLSMLIASLATLLALLIGTAVGVTAGYFESSRHDWVDNALMRMVDVALAFPYLLLITAIGVAVDRADVATIVLILGLTSWIGIARVVRAKTLQIKQHDYIAAARALGAGPWRIIRRHLLPALAGTLLVIGTQAVAQMILAEAVLGYLTVGIEPPQATWGRMLHEVEHYLGVQPLLVAAPAMAIVLAVLGCTRVGDGLRDALDPRQEATPLPARSRLPFDMFLLAAAMILLVGFARPDPLQPPRSTATSTAKSAADTPRRGGVLRLATQVALLHSLEPATAYNEAARAINDLIFARLVTHDERGKLVSELAERFEVQDSGKRFTFTLRKGLKFHDGTALTAADIKRSIERSLHPKTACPRASRYSAIVGFEAYRNGKTTSLEGLLVPSSHTFRIELSKSDASFLSLLALGFAAPVCPSSGVFVDAKKPVEPCGAGPFRFSRFVRGERIELSRFDDYFIAGRPYLDGVVWQLSVPARNQRYRFESGQLDVINTLTGIDSNRFASDPRWASQRRWVTEPATHGILLNTQMPPFDNRHLRRAVAFALDPSVLPKVRASIAATDRLVPPAVPGPDRSEPMRRFDLQAALREMALTPDYAYDPATNEGGYPEPIDYVTTPNSFDQSAGEIYQQQLARIGVRIRLKLVSWGSWLTLISRRNTVAMGWRGWQADFPDPSEFFEILTSAAIKDKGSQNASFFSNRDLDDVVHSARLEEDPQRRMKLFLRAEQIVRDEAPWIPTYVTRTLVVWQPKVRGFRPNPVWPMRVRDVWLRQEAR